MLPEVGSNETRPENRRSGLLHVRQGLPAHVPTHGGPTLTENDRGLPDQPGMLPRLPGRSPAHRTRPRDLRPLRPRPPERLAGLDDRPAALRAEDHRAAAEHRQSVPDVLLPRRHHPRRAQPDSQGPTSPSQREEADRVPHRARDTGRARRLHRPHREIAQEPNAADPALRHRRPRRRDHQPEAAGPLPGPARGMSGSPAKATRPGSSH